MDKGTNLFKRTMAWAEREGDRGKIMRKVWEGTPWMVNAYTGKIENHGRYRDMVDWCYENFGNEASPIHDTPGSWHRGGATVHGWTWFGFDSEERMNLFCKAWPTPDHAISLKDRHDEKKEAQEEKGES